MKLQSLKRNQGIIAICLVLLMLVIDQTIKIWIKTNMIEHQVYPVFSWFKIYFLENQGMAYGIQLGSKLFLTIFRICAMGAAAWFLFKVIKSRHFNTGFVAVLSLIMAGGIGNILDSIYFGACFSSSVGQVAQWVEPGTGYAAWFHGRVVDMFYFPIIQTTYPAWVPYYGGQPFVFFSPVFNFADACISVGVIAILLFYPRTLSYAIDLFFKSKKSDDTPNT